ncbi:MAG: DNA circularization N-terminal domain-containing protein [Phyllobacteriaceae bacterium]|nr:DNA circularization N-terminal domain-containing protein [Phyllobacteriaceae bacterium]
MSLDATAGLLPGLLPAVYRGIAFDMPDTTTRPGRRIAEHLFPGHDHTAYDDLGAVPEELSVSGVIIGDDHASQAQRLRAAFSRPGPGRLMHPWFGPLTVLLAEPAEVSLATNELRVVRFSATFIVLGAGRARGTAGAAARVETVATELRASSLAADTGTGNEERAVRRFAGVVASSPVGRRGIYVVPEANATQSLGAIADWARSEVDARAADSGAVAAPVAPSAEPPAIDGAHVAAQVRSLHEDLRKTAGLCIEAAALDPAAAPTLNRAAAVLVAEAARLFVHDMPDDRSSALTVRDGFTVVLQAIRGATVPASAGTGHHDMEARAAELEAAIAADINEIIGRLPRSWSMSLENDGDAWLIAHHLFGDDPEAVEPAYAAIVSRNRLRHPASIEAGSRLEIER